MKTLEHIRKQGENERTAEAFYLTGDIEKYGSGFIRIRNEVETYPTMVFSVENAPNGLLTVFSYKFQKTSATNSLNVPENVPEKRKNKILEFFTNSPSISIAELALELNTSEKTIKRDILKLKNEKRIERIGPDKGGYWRVV